MTHQTEAQFLRFTAAGRPVPKGRPRFAKGHAYTPARTAAYESIIGYVAKAAMRGRDPLAEDVRVEVDFHSRTRHRHDADNLLKACLDGMNGVVYLDDAQATDVRARVHRGSDRDATDVRIWRIT